VLVGCVAHLEEDLAGENKVAAATLERVAEQGLGDSGVVYVGGVEEVDAGFDAAVDELVGARLVERLAERHGAETEAGNGEVGVEESATVHESMISP
jgi:hypothetical protein